MRAVRSTSARPFFLGTAVLAIAILSAQARSAVADNLDVELVETVLAAHSSNAEKLGGVELRVHTVLQQLTVTRAETVHVKLADGASATYHVAPRSEFIECAIFLGDRVRRDFLGDDDLATETVKVEDGAWTQFSPESGTAWIRRQEELPGAAPIDPRQWGLDDIREDYASNLRESTLLETALSDEGEGVIARIALERPNGVRLDIDFSAAHGFLPVKVVRTNPDGSLSRITEVAYQYVPERSGWLPKRAVGKLFPPQVTTPDRPQGWTEVATAEVTAYRLLTSEEFEKAFALVIPSGTRVLDNLSRSIHVVGGPGGALARASSWLLPLAAGILALAATYALLRRYRRLSAHVSRTGDQA